MSRIFPPINLLNPTFVEPSAALFWALGIVLAHILKELTQQAGPASLKYGRGQLGSIWGKKSLPPSFPFIAVYLLYD